MREKLKMRELIKMKIQKVELLNIAINLIMDHFLPLMYTRVASKFSVIIIKQNLKQRTLVLANIINRGNK